MLDRIEEGTAAGRRDRVDEVVQGTQAIACAGEQQVELDRGVQALASSDRFPAAEAGDALGVHQCGLVFVQARARGLELGGAALYQGLDAATVAGGDQEQRTEHPAGEDADRDRGPGCPAAQALGILGQGAGLQRPFAAGEIDAHGMRQRLVRPHGVLGAVATGEQRRSVLSALIGELKGDSLCRSLPRNGCEQVVHAQCSGDKAERHARRRVLGSGENGLIEHHGVRLPRLLHQAQACADRGLPAGPRALDGLARDRKGEWVHAQHGAIALLGLDMDDRKILAARGCKVGAS